MKLVGGKRALAINIKPRLKKRIREALLQHVHIFKGFCAALLQQEQLSEERAELQSLNEGYRKPIPPSVAYPCFLGRQRRASMSFVLKWLVA